MKVGIDTLVLLLISTAFLTVLLCAVADEYWPTPAKEPQLYTVHFDGIDYQDLEQIRSTTEYSVYRTKAGKRITFKGNFYEVEQ